MRWRELTGLQSPAHGGVTIEKCRSGGTVKLNKAIEIIHHRVTLRCCRGCLEDLVTPRSIALASFFSDRNIRKQA